jgi:carbon storage regulator
MLVLSRKQNESVVIGDVIEVIVVEIRGDKVRLGIVAPKEMTVHRREAEDAIASGPRPPVSQPIEKLVGPGLVPGGPLLILSRKKNESIVINGNVTVIVIEIRRRYHDEVLLGVESPREIAPHRREVYEATKGVTLERRIRENG